jgi:hypothetical protein
MVMLMSGGLASLVSSLANRVLALVHGASLAMAMSESLGIFA